MNLVFIDTYAQKTGLIVNEGGEWQVRSDYISKLTDRQLRYIVRDIGTTMRYYLIITPEMQRRALEGIL